MTLGVYLNPKHMNIGAVDKDDNELITLEVIHQFVEVLDRYFGNVCELDLIFNFHKVMTPLKILETVTFATNGLQSSSSPHAQSRGSQQNPNPEPQTL